MTTEAEAGWTQPEPRNVKGFWRLPEAGRGEGESLPESHRGSRALLTLYFRLFATRFVVLPWHGPRKLTQPRARLGAVDTAVNINDRATYVMEPRVQWDRDAIQRISETNAQLQRR